MAITSNYLTKSQNTIYETLNGGLDISRANGDDGTDSIRLGTVYEDFHPVFGLRKFIYVQIHQSGGCTAGQLMSFRTVTITNIDSGTTTSITKAGEFGTDNALVGGRLICVDDAGAAGAAPEGEMGIVRQETANTLTIDPAYPFSVATAANDDFIVDLYGLAVIDSAAGDKAYKIAGVAMVDHDQYDKGWIQFYGIHPLVDAKAATDIPAGESVIADVGTISDGAGAAPALVAGVSLFNLKSDAVSRKASIFLNCGYAFALSATA